MRIYLIDQTKYASNFPAYTEIEKYQALFDKHECELGVGSDRFFGR